MTTENPVRISARAVIEKSESVRINTEALENLAKKWAEQGISAPGWPTDSHYLNPSSNETALTYLIILDSVNFCFWSPNGKRWHIIRNSAGYDGHQALALTLKEFFEKNPEKTDFRYWSKISLDEFQKILGGGRNLLFLEKRWEIARTVSRYFLNYYSGNPKLFIREAGCQLSVLVPKIANELFSFGDEAVYSDKLAVYFWKRAQLLAMDIYGAFNGQGLGSFEDLGYVTAFPDYKLPQILHHYGILEYDERLQKMIMEKRELIAGTNDEIEIRAATVWSIELIRWALKKLNVHLRSFEIDWLLWNQSQTEEMTLPYHRTRTIFY